jgi:large subunit ribosomal protein L3
LRCIHQLLQFLTVVEAKENVVLQKKTVEVDGYNAIQVGFEDKKAYNFSWFISIFIRFCIFFVCFFVFKSNLDCVVSINLPAEGHAKKADAAPKRFIREFRNVDVDAYEVGQELA